MEPTIYKPSIYKGAGIYNTGAEGGGGVNGDYETDFSDFDVYNKYDIPKDGYLTSYSNLATYQKENGVLKIVAPAGNVNFEFFNPIFFVKKNSILTLLDVEFESTNGYSFLWLDMYSSVALSVHKDFSADKIIFLVDANLSYTSTMTILFSDSSYKWLKTPFSFSQANNIRVEYDENETRYYVNDTLLITTYFSIAGKVNGITINPRDKKYIKIGGIKFKK